MAIQSLDERWEFFVAHASVRHGDDLQPILLAELAHRLAIAASTDLNGSWSLPLGVLGRHLAQTVKRKHGLGVQRMLGPKRAVLIEGGDAIVGLDILGAGFFRRVLNEERMAFSQVHHSRKAADRPAPGLHD